MCQKFTHLKWMPAVSIMSQGVCNYFHKLLWSIFSLSKILITTSHHHSICPRPEQILIYFLSQYTCPPMGSSYGWNLIAVLVAPITTMSWGLIHVHMLDFIHFKLLESMLSFHQFVGTWVVSPQRLLGTVVLWVNCFWLRKKSQV